MHLPLPNIPVHATQIAIYWLPCHINFSPYLIIFASCPDCSQQERSHSSKDRAGANESGGSTAGEGGKGRRHRRGGVGAAVAAGGGVAGGEREVRAGQASGVAGVDDDGAVAEERAWALGGGEVEVEEAAKGVY